MIKLDSSVSNAGLILHLSEIDSFRLFKIFEKLFIVNEVVQELEQETVKDVLALGNITIKFLDNKSKDLSKYLLERYGIHLGEAASIALCKKEKIKLFFTDDLEARETAKVLGLDAHGTLAIVTRALKNKLINKKEAIQIVNDLYSKSSLYLTKDLKNWVIKEIDKFTTL